MWQWVPPMRVIVQMKLKEPGGIITCRMYCAGESSNGMPSSTKVMLGRLVMFWQPPSTTQTLSSPL